MKSPWHSLSSASLKVNSSCCISMCRMLRQPQEQHTSAFARQWPHKSSGVQSQGRLCIPAASSSPLTSSLGVADSSSSGRKRCLNLQVWRPAFTQDATIVHAPLVPGATSAKNLFAAHVSSCLSHVQAASHGQPTLQLQLLQQTHQPQNQSHWSSVMAGFSDMLGIMQSDLNSQMLLSILEEDIHATELRRDVCQGPTERCQSVSS